MKTVGVDIAATAVRVAVVDGIDADGRARVVGIGMVPYREGVVDAGHINTPVVAAQALVAALKQAGAPRYGFIAGFGAPEVATTRISIPSGVKPSERISMLRTTDTQISPTLPLADAILDTNFVRTTTTIDGQQQDSLVVAAADHSQVELVKSLMTIARCEPRALDLTAAGLMRALVRTPRNNTEVHAMVDIGASKTTIATRQGPHLRSVRVLPVGGQSLTRAIMAATNDDLEHAERRKMDIRLTNTAAAAPVELPPTTLYGTVVAATSPQQAIESRLDEAVNTIINDLIEQIAATLENEGGAYGAGLTQAVVLSGLTALIPGLKERLIQRLGLQVQLGRPWAKIISSKSTAPYLVGDPDTPRPLLDLTTAIGLALWRKESRD